jgi:hypothetical protein
MSTELSQLPTNPSVPSKNTVIETPSYSTGDLDKKPPPGVGVMPSDSNNVDLSKMMEQVQQASQQGMTKLSAVPSTANANPALYSVDQAAQANHVPQQQPQPQAPAQPQPQPGQPPAAAQGGDYIGNYVSPQQVAAAGTKAQQNESIVDNLFEEFKFPLIICVLYYIFQMPVLRVNLLKLFPDFLKADGNLNTYGVALHSLFFGVFYYLFVKVYEMVA